MEDTNKLLIVGMVFPANNDKVHQRNWVFATNGICPTQTSTQYKDPPRILVGGKYGK